MKTLQESKHSHSPIGSHHWAATLLSFVMRTGDHLAEHGNKNYLRNWGVTLKEYATEINNYMQSLPDVKDGGTDILKIIKKHSAKPDADYTDAWLVKAMEKYGRLCWDRACETRDEQIFEALRDDIPNIVVRITNVPKPEFKP